MSIIATTGATAATLAIAVLPKEVPIHKDKEQDTKSAKSQITKLTTAIAMSSVTLVVEKDKKERCATVANLEKPLACSAATATISALSAVKTISIDKAAPVRKEVDAKDAASQRRLHLKLLLEKDGCKDTGKGIYTVAKTSMIPKGEELGFGSSSTVYVYQKDPTFVVKRMVEDFSMESCQKEFDVGCRENLLGRSCDGGRIRVHLKC